MIVLDEQLLGYGLADEIAQWYTGTVTDITTLRPGTLIPDDAIPELLRTARKPTFLTINVGDFWRRLAPDEHFCVLCFALSDRRVSEIPSLLRRVLATRPFRTRQRRLGKIARIGPKSLRFYTTTSWAVQTLEF
jgi:hypothetical protein